MFLLCSRLWADDQVAAARGAKNIFKKMFSPRENTFLILKKVLFGSTKNKTRACLESEKGLSAEMHDCKKASSGNQAAIKGVSNSLYTRFSYPSELSITVLHFIQHDSTRHDHDIAYIGTYQDHDFAVQLNC